MKLIYDKLIMEIAPRIIKKNRKDILFTIEKMIEKYLINNIKYLVLLDRIDELTEAELDMVQAELHVDFYNYSMSVEEKRKNCKASLGVHATKGTAKSIETILDSFYQGSKLYEWYETTDLDPGYFSVYYEGLLPKNTGDILKRISSTKKASQHLKGIFSFSEVKSEPSSCLIASNNSKNMISGISSINDIVGNNFKSVALENVKKETINNKITANKLETRMLQGSVLESKQIGKINSISQEEYFYSSEKTQIILEKLIKNKMVATTFREIANSREVSVILQVNNKTSVLQGGV